MRDFSAFCELFVIVSGTSSTHVRSIVEGIAGCPKEKKVRPHHIEGRSEGIWVIIDFGNVVVHVFTEDTREFYDLERLWADAPQLAMPAAASQQS